MNYGKKHTIQTKERITSKKIMRQKRLSVRIFKTTLLFILLAVIGAGIYAGLLVRNVIAQSPEITPDSVQPSEYTSFVYTRDGVLLDEFVAEGSNRVYKSMEEIPANLAHAFVAIEDERFYEHNGIDFKGLLRACSSFFTSGSMQGASTITQQLIKNNIFDFMEETTLEDKIIRKLQEQYLAIQLEKQMSKDDILENYLNTINLGQNCLGVQSAAQRYFGKDVSELTLSECAVIAAITQNPSKNNPITNPEANQARRDTVLDYMQEQGYITEEELQEALADNVYDRIQETNVAVKSQTSTDSYFIDALAEQVVEDLQEQLGYSAEQAYNALYKGGLTITATIDTTIQQICEEEVNNDSNYPSLKEWGITTYALTVTRADGSVENYDQNAISNYALTTYGDSQGLLFSSEAEASARIQEWKDATLNLQEGDVINGEVLSITPQPQASIVVMDQTTGEVKAIVGGRGEKSGSRNFNRATDSKRQPGSCFKVLSTYAPAIDAAGKTLATTILDEPYTYEDGTTVHNWWGDSYRGNMTIRKCIEQSANVCTVKMLTEITPRLGYEYLLNFGITTLVDNEQRSDGVYTDVQQALALGGITDGVTNLEMTAAYATIANQGVYNKAIFYTEIRDHDGNLLLDNTGNSKQVLKSSTAYLLTSAMEDVVTQGTGTKAKFSWEIAIAGKTGTTTSNKDIWFCGYTPYYTCSVWGGYDDNKELNNTSWHLVLWNSIMSRVHSELPAAQFTVPSDVEKVSVCTSSGKRAGSSCPCVTDYFATDTLGSEICTDYHGSYYDDDEEEDSVIIEEETTTTTETHTEGANPTTSEDSASP